MNSSKLISLNVNILCKTLILRTMIKFDFVIKCYNIMERLQEHRIVM